MPIYEYICETCSGEFEVRRSFSDSGLPPCPTCNGTGRVHRRFSTPAIVFKGSGFYVTDARGKNPAGSSPKSAKETSSSSDESKPTPETTPAKTTDSPT